MVGIRQKSFFKKFEKADHQPDVLLPIVRKYVVDRNLAMCISWLATDWLNDYKQYLEEKKRGAR